MFKELDMSLPSKQDICTFVERSIFDKQYNDELLFPLPMITIERVKRILYLDMNGYSCVISSHSIRHIKRGHPDEVKYICNIVEILETFYRVEKSITRDQKTGASLVSLEFYKKYEGSTVKLVKLKIHIKKRLELKTLFIRQ